MTVTKEQVIERIRQHAKLGCDRMEIEVCSHLLWEIDSLFELDKLDNSQQGFEKVVDSPCMLPAESSPVQKAGLTNIHTQIAEAFNKDNKKGVLSVQGEKGDKNE